MFVTRWPTIKFDNDILLSPNLNAIAKFVSRNFKANSERNLEICLSDLQTMREMSKSHKYTVRATPEARYSCIPRIPNTVVCYGFMTGHHKIRMCSTTRVVPVGVTFARRGEEKKEKERVEKIKSEKYPGTATRTTLLFSTCYDISSMEDSEFFVKEGWRIHVEYKTKREGENVRLICCIGPGINK